MLGEIVRRHARYRGDRLAYVLDHADGRTERVTYAALNEGTNRLAHVLAGRGVRRGDRVAILAHNCVEYPWTYFACCKLGAIVVPVNTRYKREEIRHAIEFADARVALVGPEFLGDVLALRAAGALSGLEEVLLVDADAQPPASRRLAGARSAARVRRDQRARAASAPPDEHDAHVMLFTSGTTGVPKGALLSQRSYFLQAGLTQTMNGLTDRDTGLSMFPMFHMGGWATPLGLLVDRRHRGHHAARRAPCHAAGGGARARRLPLRRTDGLQLDAGPARFRLVRPVVAAPARRRNGVHAARADRAHHACASVSTRW